MVGGRQDLPSLSFLISFLIFPFPSSFLFVPIIGRKKKGTRYIRFSAPFPLFSLISAVQTVLYPFGKVVFGVGSGFGFRLEVGR